MIRVFDILFSLFGLLFLFPLGIVLYVIGIFDTGSPFFVQERVGKNKRPFSLFKFRTMKVNTKSVASHLVNPDSVTSFGRFLRRSKLDELPQLWNVLKGDMSLVGPRPNLFNQKELILERDKVGVYRFLPGITGLAQINEIDMSTPKKLAETDILMLKDISLKKYFGYIFSTILGKGQGDRIREEQTL